MASPFWAQVARTCAFTHTRAVRSVPILRRSFVALASRNHAIHPRLSRSSSAAAAAVSDTPDVAKPVNESPRFSQLKGAINDRTLQAITNGPFHHTHMSVVQAEVFPLLPQLGEPYSPDSGNDQPRDLLVKARTGTGKTMAFLVPAIEARLKSLEAHANKVVPDSGLPDSAKLRREAIRAHATDTVGTLIISPTRELASQIATEAMKLTSHHPGFEVKLFVGGESKSNQLYNWRKGRRDIVVTTPGRMRDFLESEPSVSGPISRAEVLILDEADTLLEFGFRDDIEMIRDCLPPTPQRQTFLFSATLGANIREIARASLAKNHIYINCVSEDTSPVHAHIPQYHTILPAPDQQISHVLRTIAHDQLTHPGNSKVIVFLPTTKVTELFSDILREVGRDSLPARTRVYEIHSKRNMNQRSTTNKNFRADTSGACVLVTSDVSARGVDYPGVTRVIQVGIPSTPEQYVHRVGRTGRAGATKGRGDLILLPWEMGYVSRTLSHIPLKPVTVAELTSQTKELAAKFDENPASFFPPAPPAPPSFKKDRGRREYVPIVGPRSFNTPTAALVEEIDKSVSDLVMKLDEEQVIQAAVAMMGFYAGKVSELRTSKMTILEGIQAWAMEAGGASRPPHIPSSILAGDGSRRPPPRERFVKPEWASSPRDGGFSRDRFGGDRSAGGYSGERSSSRRPWEGRGSSASRNRSDSFDQAPTREGRGSFASRDRFDSLNQAPGAPTRRDEFAAPRRDFPRENYPRREGSSFGGARREGSSFGGPRREGSSFGGSRREGSSFGGSRREGGSSYQRDNRHDDRGGRRQSGERRGSRDGSW